MTWIRIFAPVFEEVTRERETTSEVCIFRVTKAVLIGWNHRVLCDWFLHTTNFTKNHHNSASQFTHKTQTSSWLSRTALVHTLWRHHKEFLHILHTNTLSFVSTPPLLISSWKACLTQHQRRIFVRLVLITNLQQPRIQPQKTRPSTTVSPAR